MEWTQLDNDVLIIGAGMAGLMAAREFQRAGRSVLDQGCGVGDWRAGGSVARHLTTVRNSSPRATRASPPC